MSELSPQPQSIGRDIADLYAREVQIRRNGEDEGYSDAIETYIKQGVFETPSSEVAEDLYQALVYHADPELRAVALEGLGRLQEVAPETATHLQRALLEDDDPQIRNLAHDLYRQLP